MSDGGVLGVLGTNLRQARIRRGLSIERLARVARISRAMISQIEHGRSSPTVNVLARISRALGLPFAALLSAKVQERPEIVRHTESRRTANGQLCSRALFPSGLATPAQLYELELGASGAEWSAAHPPGTWENLVVAAGRVEVELPGDVHPLETGDSIVFPADVPHVYRNLEPVPALMYLVVTYRSL